MIGPIRRQIPAVAGMAAVGILAGHWLAYLLAFPDPHERSHLLELTGHTYFQLFIPLAIAALVAGVAHLAVTGRGTLAAMSRRQVAVALSTIQAGGFTVLEVGERAFAHGGVDAGLLHPAVLVGLVLQVVIAWIGSWILTGVVRLVRALGRRPEQHRSRVAPRPLVSQISRIRPRLIATSLQRRGPPVPLPTP